MTPVELRFPNPQLLGVTTRSIILFVAVFLRCLGHLKVSYNINVIVGRSDGTFFVI
jgi:hypothetical protein